MSKKERSNPVIEYQRKLLIVLDDMTKKIHKKKEEIEQAKSVNVTNTIEQMASVCELVGEIKGLVSVMKIIVNDICGNGKDGGQR